MFSRRIILRIAGIYVFFSCLLFVPAGTLAWGRAWWLLALLVAGSFLSMKFVFPGREDLLKERLKSPLQKGQPLADKIILPLFIAAFYGSMVFTSLDVFRFHLLGRPGGAGSFFGVVLFIAGWCVIAVSLKQNDFAAPVVRRQEERRHTLVDTGIYALVRHPMYAGIILLLIGIPLLLQSYAGVVFGVVPGGLLVLRIRFEEDFLKRELPGYEAYIHKVRYKLFPHIW